METLSKELEQLERQFGDSDDALYRYMAEDRVADSEGIKNLVEAAMAREFAELELLRLLKTR